MGIDGAKVHKNVQNYTYGNLTNKAWKNGHGRGLVDARVHCDPSKTDSLARLALCLRCVYIEVTYQSCSVFVFCDAV